MFFEPIGRFFSSKSALFLSLFLSIPFLCTLLALFSSFSSHEELEYRFFSLQKKAPLAFEKKERKRAFLARYQGKNPFYLSEKIESFSFLEKEKALLEKLSSHPYLEEKRALNDRLEFLSKENRLLFQEEKIQRNRFVKEVFEKQSIPVQMDKSDLKWLLAKLEGKKIEDASPDEASPQFLIRSFQMEKKLTPLQTYVFEVQMELIQREFFP